MDVDKGGEGLHGHRMLRMVEEVSCAGEIFRIPFEDVELRIVCSLVSVGVDGTGEGDMGEVVSGVGSHVIARR